ncbi:MAG: hypothetical protein LBM62_07265 [Mediterranea sp.]|jgi:hypothetical protein|nr:hypothetical protein [Mediterranea sp.]
MNTKAFLWATLLALSSCSMPQQPGIDRHALVIRNNPHVTLVDTLASLSVGNGRFAFTADVTGLQTFPDSYKNGIPTGTLSKWGHYRSDLSRPFDLGVVGLELGREVTPADLTDIRQTLDLWNGRINSRFVCGDTMFSVLTTCHPELDLVSAAVVSKSRAGINLRFGLSDSLHTVEVVHFDVHSATLKHTLSGDTTVYYVTLGWEDEATLSAKEKNYFVLTPKSDTLRFACLFSVAEPKQTLPAFHETDSVATTYRHSFWEEGAAVDFSHCTDPRARELERRVVLSRYLLSIRPDAQWHEQAWLGLWGHEAMLDTVLHRYKEANDTVTPHPYLIYMVELFYRARPSANAVTRYAPLVERVVDSLCLQASYDGVRDRYLLKREVPAQDSLPAYTLTNPPFELSYLRFALQTAQQWRERGELLRRSEWDRLVSKLSMPAYTDYGLYLAAESAVDTYHNPRYADGHPMILAAVGLLPMSELIRADYMRNTLLWAWDNWNWSETQGWNYSLVAMNAARLNEPEHAVAALMMRRLGNIYLNNGYNYHNHNLRNGLSGNGALLVAVALMCAGWDDCGVVNPGFPKNGTWDVRWEGLKPLP